MLDFKEPSVYERSKCFFTYGRLPHIDPQQLPKDWEKKGKPWTSILSKDFVRRVDLVMPRDSWKLIQQTFLSNARTPQFYRVSMSLGQILEGAFFTEYIKIGDVIMLSRGRIDLDNVFTLKDGKLKLYLDRATYERAGLVGKPYGAKGSRALKPRWVVEFDLRSPSMFRGKKGFDRLIYACKNVFDKPVSWLFCRADPKVPSPDPLMAFSPTECAVPPEVAEAVDVASPILATPAELASETSSRDPPESICELYEWISLVRLQSPRVSSTDTIDPYLSRYRVADDTDNPATTNLCTITWEGLLTPSFARQMLVDIILLLPSREWFALAVSSFSRNFLGDTDECTIFRPPNAPGEYLLWDIRSHE